MQVTIIDNDSNEIQIEVNNTSWSFGEKIHLNFVNSIWNDLKNQREVIFKETSWVRERHLDEKAAGLPTSISDSKFQEWLVYWQKLRDITIDFSNPFDVIFPTMPNNSNIVETEDELKQYNQRIFGQKQSEIIVDLIGAKNLELARNNISFDSASLLQTLGVIKNLMDTGALKKARDLTAYYRPSFSNYETIFTKNINDINDYLLKMGY